MQYALCYVIGILATLLHMKKLLQLFVLFTFAMTLVSCNGDGNSIPKPEIKSIQPDSGPTGTAVTISGQGFQPDASDLSVSFNGSNSTITSATGNEIKTEVPEDLAEGSAEISVTVGDEMVSGPSFMVEAEAPGISAIDPDSGTTGTKVIIEGMNFSATASENTITFNGVQAQVNDATESTLQTQVPQGATDGPVEVVVNQQSTTGPAFDVLAPRINSVTPDTAVNGSVVAVKGKYFGDQLSRNKVSFGGIVADVDSASGNTLYTTVPANATGGPVKVLVGEQSSDGVPFELITTIQACYGNDVQLDATLEWVSQGLTTSDKDDKSEDMAMDSNGNLYMVLRDRGVVAKYDPEGDQVWESNFNDKLPSTTWRGIEVDGNSVYIVGERGLIGDQNLGDAKLEYHFSTLNSGNADAGTADPILAKLDAGSGSLGWAQQFGSPDLDELNNETVAVLPSGEILVSVKMSGPFKPSNHEPNGGTHDVGIAKFQKNGTLQTVQQIEAYTAPYSIATDDQSRVFLGARNDDGNTVFARLSSNLQIEASSEQVTRQIKQPIPMPDGGAVVYGNTDVSLESGLNVFIKDAYVQKLNASGGQEWVHQQKFDRNGSTKYIGGVRLPDGGVVIAGNNASEIGGLPYLGVYADDGRPLFIDGSEKSTFFEFEDDKKGRGFPTAIEAYRNSSGDIQVFTLGVTTSSWPGRNDDDNVDPKGGKDMWITGMSLECTVTTSN